MTLIEVEDDIFVCDDNSASTENVYQPMNVNTTTIMTVESGLYVMRLFQLMISHLRAAKEN